MNNTRFICIQIIQNLEDFFNHFFHTFNETCFCLFFYFLKVLKLSILLLLQCLYIHNFQSPPHKILDSHIVMYLFSHNIISINSQNKKKILSTKETYFNYMFLRYGTFDGIKYDLKYPFAAVYYFNNSQIYTI